MPSLSSFRFFPLFTALLFCASLPNPASAAQWTWTWKPAADEKNVTATVCPFKYDKKWGYAVELDDGNHDTDAFAPDFFAQYKYTDAPPGLPGGKPQPVVGDFAIYLYAIGCNSAYLSIDEIRNFQTKGWGIANHSYFHRGHAYNPPEILSPEEFREDLYWSQALDAVELGHGRAPSDFVYPNGYRDYSKYLEQFGIVSSTLVGGESRSLSSEKTNLLFLDRAYLDEGFWTSQYAKGDPLNGFLKSDGSGPAPGDIVIDFTHFIDPKPDSVNQKRWQARLEKISSQYGAGGTDEFWSAPVQDIVNYYRAAKAAQVKVEPGKLDVSIPNLLPGSPLTIKLENVPADTTIPAPEGGSVYRKDSTVWITSPMIGLPGASPPTPAIKMVHQGPVNGTVQLDKPEKIAGVRIKQNGHPLDLKVDLILPDGTVKNLGEHKQTKPWVGGYELFSLVPNAEPIVAQTIQISPAKDDGLKEVEVWAIDDSASAPAK